MLNKLPFLVHLKARKNREESLFSDQVWLIEKIYYSKQFLSPCIEAGTAFHLSLGAIKNLNMTLEKFLLNIKDLSRF